MRPLFTACFVLAAALSLTPLLVSQAPPADPWPASAILEPAAFAKTLASPAKPPLILSTAFPILYNSRHLPHAIFAGPGSSAEGIEALKKAVQNLSKDTEIVIYCGCCPMDRCPNIRPAFKTLHDLGFTKVRVLSIPTNMATDWFGKGYPSEEGIAGGAK